jgi:hypothetical protein
MDRWAYFVAIPSALADDGDLWKFLESDIDVGDHSMKCTLHSIEMEYAGENPFGGDIWYCEACHVAEEAEFSRTSEDDYPDYEDNDPVLESARLSAEAHLEQVAGDLDDSAYANELDRLTRVEYERLLKDQADELAYVKTLTPEQQEEYWKWDGQKPPTDGDYQDLV